MRWYIVCVFLLLALPVIAQGQGAIAIIDGERVLRDSEAGKKLFADVKALRDKKQQEIDQRQQSIQTMQEKLNKEKDILSPDTQEKRRAEIQKALTDAKRFREDSEQEIQVKLDSAMSGMQERLLPIIQKLGEEKGYTMIVGRQFTIWHDAKVEITDEVIRRFNEANVATSQPQTQKQQ